MYASLDSPTTAQYLWVSWSFDCEIVLSLEWFKEVISVCSGTRGDIGSTLFPSLSPVGKRSKNKQMAIVITITI
jgi:hypothetical protein